MSDSRGEVAPVLVVGAGPTGLLMATELRRRGVPCRLIDSHAGPMHWDRATVVHPRSLQIFEALGIVDGLIAVGVPQRVISVHSEGRLLGRIDLSISGSVYGYNLGLSEEVTEAGLTELFGSLGGAVERGSRLVGLTPHGDGVTAEIETDGVRASVEASWVVGCDGVRSATRELGGFAFEGHPIARQWAVFDASVVDWPETYEGVFVYNETVPIIMTALPGRRWRVYIRPSSPDSDLVEEATATLRMTLPSATFADVQHATRFECFTSIAEHYREGRLLLAGDSAHLCSPAEGHGMNTGLQDAFNLAWKLALVHDGVADERLLDSYEVERRPVAARITKSGDESDEAQLALGPAARAQRDKALVAMLADPEQLRHQVMVETELIIDYAGSPILAGDGDAALAPGFRLPDAMPIEGAGASDGVRRAPTRLAELARGAGHVLLLIAGEGADAARFAAVREAIAARADASPLVERIATVAAGEGVPADARLAPADAEVLGVEDITLLAVRPDAYVGLRADDDHAASFDRYEGLLLGR
jgi:2-polyprenyl-6-methoxyphenol hydroxylase-like FAD-dependent oxidoreductase